MNLLTFGLIIACLGALIGAVLTALIAWYVVSLRHVGKSWIFILPETVGTEATVLRRKLKDGKFDIQSRNHDAERDDKDRFLPQGNLAYQARGDLKGPLHVMSSYGANLIAPAKLEAAKVIEERAVADWLRNYKRQPTAQETGDKGAFAVHLAAAWTAAKDIATRFLVSDPLAYFKACQENDMQDFLTSQTPPKDPWFAKPIVVIGIILLVGILAILGVIILKVMPAIQAAGS